MDFDPGKLEKLAHGCTEAAREYADYVHQERFFKVLSDAKLASLIMEAKVNDPDQSNVGLENIAKSSDSWIVFIEEQTKMLKQAGRRKIKYENAIRLWETERSMLALRREEFKRL